MKLRSFSYRGMTIYISIIQVIDFKAVLAAEGKFPLSAEHRDADNI